MIETFFLYNALLAVCFLLSLLAENSGKKLPLFLAYFLVFFVTVIRFDVGHDYSNYAKLAYVLSGDFEPGLFLLTSFQQPLFGLLSYLFRSSDYPYLWCLGVYSAITVYFLYKVFDYYGIHKWGFFVFFTLGVFFFTLDVVKQGLTISVFLYALRFVERKQFFKFTFCILLCSFAHISTLFMLPFYFLLRMRPRKMFYTLIIIVFLIGYFLRIWDSFRGLVFSYIPYYSAKYMNIDTQTGASGVGTGLGIIMNTVLAMFVVNALPGNNKALINAAFWGILIFLFSNGNYNIERLSYYLFYSLMVSIPMVIRCGKSLQWAYALLLVLFINFQRNIAIGPRGTTPYQTIFSENFKNQYFRPDE